MKSVLIGFNGFVGSNLDHRKYDLLVNSRNSSSLRNQHFDRVLCCGFTGTKYIANENPMEDWNKIAGLLEILMTISCSRMTLISTIDIYESNPYGRHRKRIEEILLEKFKDRCRIVRLPGIYGRNLKKNALFDLINQHELGKICLQDQYQWYDLGDLETDLRVELPLMELFPEPLTIGELNSHIFKYSEALFSKTKTRHYERRPYVYDKCSSLNKISNFVGSARN